MRPSRRWLRLLKIGNVFVGEAGRTHLLHPRPTEIARTRELNRDPGYAFISDCPAEGVRNEVSFIMGFDVAAADVAESGCSTPSRREAGAKSDAKPKTSVGPALVALVDEATFERFRLAETSWSRTRRRRGALIAEMRQGAKLVIKAASLRGHQSIDTYSLNGLRPGDGAAAEGMSGEGTPGFDALPAAGIEFDSEKPLARLVSRLGFLGARLFRL